MKLNQPKSRWTLRREIVVILLMKGLFLLGLGWYLSRHSAPIDPIHHFVGEVPLPGEKL